MAAAAALAAHHHHRRLSSSSPAARSGALHHRLPFSSPPPPRHGCSWGARALRCAAAGDGGASSSRSTVAPPPAPPSSLEELYRSCTSWTWRGMRVNYLVRGDGPPLLLVHGFGASVGHWRRNIGVLSESYTVYAIDLLGFGASEKPPGFCYTMETWAELILDFLDEVVKRPTVLVGNSVGSLACVMAAADRSFLSWNNLKDILLSVYGNKDAVDDELVEIIRGPADGEGALDAFVSTVTGPPGPSPIALMPAVRAPVLVLWGDRDPFTPIDGPVGRYFSALPGDLPNVTLHMLEGVGHCPHDDRPDLVHAKLLPWLHGLPSSAAAPPPPPPPPRRAPPPAGGGLMRHPMKYIADVYREIY
uniref:AB hydrolase-1 domain-containing protein n=1 Tax=Oryza brachyantha TaxID=4533 RepID=J3M794_ORYBR